MENIWLLDDSLRVQVFYECDDCDFRDNVCISFREVSATDEKLFKADETNIYLTAEQADRLATALMKAARQSMGLEEED